MKLCWVDRKSTDMGNALGYSTHNNAMKKYSQSYFEFDNSADVAITIVPADHFRPVEGKFNVLFTMWEALDLPDTYIEGLNKADLIIVPCRFCKDLFSRYTDVPIEVCWEGVESKHYPYFKRSNPRRQGGKFRFLWLGAANPRKGYPFVVQATKLAEQLPDIEIYMKTTVPKLSVMQTFQSLWRHRKRIFKDDKGKVLLKRVLARIPKPSLYNKVKRMGRYKNVILDTRKLPLDELKELYNSAHCFLLPTTGEGWGLTLCEAMATGCPSIATNVTGVREYFDDNVGYEIKHSQVECDMENYDIRTNIYLPDMSHFISQLIHVYHNYDQALNKGHKGSLRIHKKFTWEHSAKRLADILYSIEKTGKVKNVIDYKHRSEGLLRNYNA